MFQIIFRNRKNGACIGSTKVKCVDEMDSPRSEDEKLHFVGERFRLVGLKKGFDNARVNGLI